MSRDERQTETRGFFGPIKSVNRWLAWPFILLINFYRRWISPSLPPACRYHPSCSAYGKEALTLHGLVLGLPLTVWRVLRCNPFSRGGYDPVPGSDTTVSVEPERGDRKEKEAECITGS